MAGLALSLLLLASTGRGAGAEGVYFFDLWTNPGWNAEGQWALGRPEGVAGDPSAGFNGTNVFGYNLAGAYPNDLPERFLTAGPFDFSNHSNIVLGFMSWMGIQDAASDHATLQVRHAGGPWITLWNHAGDTVQDTAWQLVQYSLPSSMNWSRDVWVRWGMGPTDASVTSSGWNLDDIGFSAVRGAPPQFTWQEPAEGAELRLGQAHPLIATSNNGVPVTFSVVNGPATIEEGQVTVTGVGTVILQAAQAGDTATPPVSMRRAFNRSEVRLSPVGTWPGHARGYAMEVTVVDTTAYVTLGANGLEVLDVSNPAEPTPLGGYDTGGSAGGIQVLGDIAYVADYDAGLEIIDVSNPAKPVRLGGYNTSGYAYGVHVVGTLAYVADRDAGLQIIDVSNPAKPWRLSGYDTSGSAYGIHVVGTLAYVADYNAGLQIIDVTNPAKPLRVGGYDTRGYARGVQVVENRAYIADSGGGLEILDVSNSANPTRIGGYNTSGYALRVQVIGGAAYIADQDAGVQIVDVSNPANPVRTGGYDTAGSARDIFWHGGFAYVADFVAGLQVLDLSNSSNPVRVGGFDTAGYSKRIRCLGGTACLADFQNGFQILDVSNPSNPVLQGRYLDRLSIEDVTMVDNLLYVAGGAEGLVIFDRSDPANLVRLGTYNTVGHAFRAQVLEGLAFVADGASGLHILDVSNPLNPLLLGTFDSPGTARAVHVSGGLAYVADGTAGLSIVDVTDPTAPALVGACDTDGESFAIQVVGDFAYLASGYSGLEVVDVSDPAHPLRIANGNPPAYAYDVVVDRNLAYVACGSRGVSIVDVSDPNYPVRMTEFDTPGYAEGITVAGDVVYVADGSPGLQVLQRREGLPQTLTFNPPTTLPMDAGPMELTATTSSGLPVAFALVSGPATLTGNHLTATGAGEIVVRADQAGDAQYFPVSVERKMTFIKVVQSLTWVSPQEGTDLTIGQEYALEAAASSGLPVVYAVLHGPATIHENRVVTTGPGSVVLEAVQMGDARYHPVGDHRTFNWNRDFRLSASPLGNWSDSPDFTHQVQVVENLAYVAGATGLHIIDVGIPQTPSRLGGLYSQGPAVGVHVLGNRAHVANHVSGIRIVGVDDPAAPVLLANYQTGGTALAIRVDGSQAFVADGDSGLRVLGIGAPSNPVPLGGYDTPGYSSGVEVIGNLAYVADGSSGLQVIDVSVPARPTRVGGSPTGGSAMGIQVIGKLAYVAADSAGLVILDVGNPANPTILCSCDTPGYCSGIQVIGNVAYVADGPSGLLILDVSKPESPVALGGYDTPGSCQAVQVAGSLAYVADGSHGLRILQLREGLPQTVEFVLPATVRESASPLTLAATASSGLPVSFSVVSGPATFSHGQLVFTGPGILVVRAEQAGDERFLPATVDRTLEVTPQPRVVARHVFYNQSVHDGANPAPSAADDDAIAPDKTALLPGSKATFANYTSYTRGLNGVMVDIAGLPGTPTAADFAFRIGNTVTPESWPAAAAPAGVTVRRGAGVDGSDRVTLIWGADAAKKSWLQIQVLATATTGLAEPDVFYFGNALGETGNSVVDGRVTAADALRVLGNVTSGAALANRFDINRDGKVGAADRLSILGNLSVLTPLLLLDLTGGALLQAEGPASPIASGPALTGLRPVAGGVRVQWMSDGSSVTLWTTESLTAPDWEILEHLPATQPPGTPAIFVLPVDPDGLARFYRLESARDR